MRGRDWWWAMRMVASDGRVSKLRQKLPLRHGNSGADRTSEQRRHPLNHRRRLTLLCRFSPRALPARVSGGSVSSARLCDPALLCRSRTIAGPQLALSVMDAPYVAFAPVPPPSSADAFAYPSKHAAAAAAVDPSPVLGSVGGKAKITTTTTSSTTSTQQRSGWTPNVDHTNTTSKAANASPSPGSSPSPPAVSIHNYQITNHVTIQVGSPAAATAAATHSSPTHHDVDEPSDSIIESVRNVRKSSPTSAAAAGVVPPLMIPRPPESARPSTTKSPSSQQQSSPPSGSVTARPNTAREGPAPKQPAAAAAAAAPSNAGAPAVSHYAVGRTIGEGTFGKVVKGIHKLTGLPVAIKILEKERIVDLADVERVKREIHILTRVRHPNVIRLFEVIDSPRHIFLIMEHCSSGELFDYIVAQGRVKEDQACRIFHQIINGVDYFHQKGIIHRDLKPENLLLCQNPGAASGSGAASAGSNNDYLLKIVDFGLGNVTKHGKLLKTACGSPCYAAPEMIAGKRYVGQGSDLWSAHTALKTVCVSPACESAVAHTPTLSRFCSCALRSLGVILFALVCGYLPFEDGNTARLYEKIMQGEYEIPEFVSGEARDLIQKLLTTDPRKRYNAEQVRRHPWYARMQVATDPYEEGGGALAPVVPGPQASGKRVRRTIGGQNVDDEHEIEQEVLRHMVMLGYHPQQVVESINNNRHDHFAATYHLLLLKKSLASKQQMPSQKPASSSSSSVANGSTRVPAPPVVPRIPTSGAPSDGAPLVPSAPVATHHHPVPPQGQKPSQQQQRPGTQGGNPAAAFSQSQPQPPSAARVQSAGTVRPAIPGSAAAAYPSSARPTTSYVQTKPSSSGSDVVPQAAWSSEVQSSPLGVANGVNGGTGVNSYMQHYQAQQQQQAALYGQQQQPNYSYASATGASGARPPSSASGRTPAPPKPSTAPKSASSGAYRISSGRAGGRTGSQQQKAKSSTGPLSQSLFVTNPNAAMDQQMSASLGYPSASPNSVVASALAHRSAHLSATGAVGTAGLAIGPATGRPMTSRITGSTGGVSHRLYLPPSEKAAHDLAAAAALAASFGSAVNSRPGTGTGARPSSGGYGVPARPGTSASTHRGTRPPSGARNIPSGISASARGSSGAYKGNGRDLDDDDDWEAPLAKHPGSSPVASGPSAFNAQLSALSFKSARTILEELQRVMTANGLQSTLLPPSFSGPAGSPQGKFVPPPGGVAAPISISSLRPPSREDGAAAGVSATHVLECRQGSNRFQFHVAPLPAASARIAHELDADATPNSPTHSFSVRVKRVLGDAQTFKDLCARILPQLKL